MAQPEKKGVVAVILVGGPTRGTRFGPLEIPKFLFPIGDQPLVGHHLSSLQEISRSSNYKLNEIFLIGFDEKKTSRLWENFIDKMKREKGFQITFLKEHGEQRLGTGGGLEFFRKDILRSSPDNVILLHGDVFCQFPIISLLNSHQEHVSTSPECQATIMVVNCDREYFRTYDTVSHYGCVIMDPKTEEILHYVEKPETYVSRSINGGAYCFSTKFFELLDQVSQGKKRSKLDFVPEYLQLEQEVIGPRCGSKMFYGYEFANEHFWSQVKEPADALLCNSEWLSQKQNKPATSPQIIPPVYIENSAVIDPTAKLGPNVSILAGCKVEKGARVLNSIVMEDTTLGPHSVVVNSVVGWKSKVGSWARIEGVQSNKRESSPKDGNSVTVLGHEVKVWPEVIIRSCITLHNRDFTEDKHNDILL